VKARLPVVGLQGLRGSRCDQLLAWLVGPLPYEQHDQQANLQASPRAGCADSRVYARRLRHRLLCPGSSLRTRRTRARRAGAAAAAGAARTGGRVPGCGARQRSRGDAGTTIAPNRAAAARRRRPALTRHGRGFSLLGIRTGTDVVAQECSYRQCEQAG